MGFWRQDAFLFAFSAPNLLDLTKKVVQDIAARNCKFLCSYVLKSCVID
jgi:hypothetical protein